MCARACETRVPECHGTEAHRYCERSVASSGTVCGFLCTEIRDLGARVRTVGISWLTQVYIPSHGSMENRRREDDDNNLVISAIQITSMALFWCGNYLDMPERDALMHMVILTF
ncbi:hypothetical protein PoB_000630500 [Plakobranchus ocellatus]|uniref:Uncharacterized protein n=1 Tax=Plakobranchus ocellatus TaxID=259542 RepID=A0AAV3YAJ8_9GAST|nr:hypothetical protein PoB_000630500 [Plakobranchus ocellatus]